MRIAVLVNLKENAPTWDGMSPDKWDDLDNPATPAAIVRALESYGHEAVFLEANIAPPHNLIERLRDYRPDLCFNIAEGHFGDGRESQIPAILDMLQIPYTASGVLSLALTLDKPVAKCVLRDHGLPTPEFQVFQTADDPLHDDLVDKNGRLRFPLLVKPSREGTSMGISAESIVRSVDDLRRQITRLIDRYQQPILCEQFVDGREIMIGIVGNLHNAVPCRAAGQTRFDTTPDDLHVLPIQEVDFLAYGESEAGLYTNRMKTEWADDFHYKCPAPLDPDLAHHLRLLAVTAFYALKCHDMARVDFRLDGYHNQQPYILEINPLPGLSPGISDLCLQADAAGWRYEQLINAIVQAAARRHNLSFD